MKFHKVEDNVNYYCRFESENGKWELGLQARTFGRWQLGFSPVDAIGPTREYCLGDDNDFIDAAIITVMTILLGYPEDTPERQIYRDFPNWQVRPISGDEKCWGQLQKMAEEQINRMWEKSA